MRISICNYSNKKKNKRKMINNNNLKFLGNKVLMILLLLYPLLNNDYKLIKFVNVANSKIIVKSINNINELILNPSFKPKPDNITLIDNKTFEIQFLSFRKL